MSINPIVNKNGGQIKGDEIAIASLNGSVINETYSNTYTEDSVLNKKTLFGTKQLKNGDFTNTEIGKTSSIESTGGDLVIFAKEDITNVGANLKAENNVILKTQDGDINLNAIKKDSGHNLNFSGGFDKSKDVEYQTSDIESNNIIMQSANDINLQASKLKAKEDINLNASNDVNVEALNNEYYRDRQITTKGAFSKKTTRDMEYKESVNSSEFNAENIYISSGNDVNLQATKLKAKENIVVDADWNDPKLVDNFLII
ncbi:hemagglutinin repeat-containing protein [Aliarcobacter skirrowii]|uniref:hemagglutinin repeat-containing protein n=1 Tax=Aliarcobacter skirrowii TaxID=28200 RepID=UPI0032078BAD